MEVERRGRIAGWCGLRAAAALLHLSLGGEVDARSASGEGATRARTPPSPPRNPPYPHMTRRHRERCTARSAIIGGHAAAHCLPEDIQAPKNRPRTLPSTHPLKPKNLSGVESIRKTNASKIDMRFP